MGLYLYGCYAPSRNITVQLPDGKHVEACVCCMITKPYFDKQSHTVELPNGWGYASRPLAMKVGRIDSLWQHVLRPRHALLVSERRSVVGDLLYSTKDTPCLWLEEYTGVLPVGLCQRHRGGLWVMNEWGSGYAHTSPEWKSNVENQYRAATLTNSVSVV